jgi:hypothetical protein
MEKEILSPMALSRDQIILRFFLANKSIAISQLCPIPLTNLLNLSVPSALVSNVMNLSFYFAVVLRCV